MTTLHAVLCLTGIIGAQTGEAPSKPLFLTHERQAHYVELRLHGYSDEPVRAQYTLEVSSGVEGKQNRTVNRGHVWLEAGRPATVATVRLGPDLAWQARLRVKVDGSVPYESEQNGS